MTTVKKILLIVLASCLGLLAILVAIPEISAAVTYVRHARMEKALLKAQKRFTSSLTSSEGSGCFNLIILDESGSMQGLEDATISGANETIASIKAASDSIPGLEQYLTLVTFSYKVNEDTLNVINYLTPIDEVKVLTGGDYNPDGTTPLYDAVGDMLSRLSPIVPEDMAALVTIITDGLENSSKRYSSEDVKGMVQALEERGWTFTYIGANQDAIREAEKIGISNALNFKADTAGVRSMMSTERKSRSNYYNEVGKSRTIIDRRRAGVNFFN